jgi:hypothetical protein
LARLENHMISRDQDDPERVSGVILGETRY